MSDFRADCSRCCGLCCVVPAQLKVQGFGVDKPAETPCVHLDLPNHCAIHDKREARGYSACTSFDCFGVGQWITQQQFGGADWSASPDLTRQMFAAYSYWLPRFRAAALIEAALPYVRNDARSQLATRMEELTSGESEAKLKIDDARLRSETLMLIREALGIDDKTV